MAEISKYKPGAPWRQRLYETIFEAETPSGRAFDIGLIALILASVITVLLESIASVRVQHGATLRALEWVFTLLFTIEYILRLVSVRRPLRYARSFFGIVDLLSILPTYLSVLFPGAQTLLVIRVLRILRMFRIFKMAHYIHEGQTLIIALRASRPKITVFLGAVLSVTVIVGALMYLIEGGVNEGFDSIPRSIYWSIVTLTTVGYGDISPRTVLGQLLASMLMITGYGIIAVPTGIVSVELARAANAVTTQACPNCGAEGHDIDAVHCKYCGAALE